jgi:hypothetical protein
MEVSGQRHAPAALYPPGEKTPGTHCTGRWVGPRAGLDTRGYRKNSLPLPEIEPRSPGRPVRSQTLHCLSYPVRTMFMQTIMPGIEVFEHFMHLPSHRTSQLVSMV